MFLWVGAHVRNYASAIALLHVHACDTLHRVDVHIKKMRHRRAIDLKLKSQNLLGVSPLILVI
jgi:hypothetical protein